MSSKSRKKKKRLRSILSMVRQVRRQIEIENGGPKEFAKVWKTHKKDKFDKSSNNVRPEDLRDD